MPILQKLLIRNTMKRLFTIAVAVAAVLSCGAAFAQTPKAELMYEGTEKTDAMSVITGSTGIFNEKVVCSLGFDFSDALIVNFERDNVTIEKVSGSIDDYNRSHGEDYVQNWPMNLDRLNVMTCLAFTKKFKAEFRTKEYAPDAKYDVVIRPALFDMGHFVALGSFKDGGNIIKGIMYVYEAGTDNLVASFDLNYLRGNNVGYGNNDRLEQLGKAIAKELKKLK